MANSLCLSPLISLNSTQKPGISSISHPRMCMWLISHKFTTGKGNWITDPTHCSKSSAFEALKVNATKDTPKAKTNSILCHDCEGNGAKQCGQCEGTGLNLVDHFDGRFKAGGSCWLCRGKREVLCGSCNGAGFLGGFMSTFED